MVTYGPEHRKVRPYREIGGPDGLLAKTRAFTGHSMWAAWYNGVYYVYSYNTLVASYDYLTGLGWITDRYYSKTTSRHLGLIRAWMPGADPDPPEVVTQRRREIRRYLHHVYPNNPELVTDELVEAIRRSNS